MHDPYRQPVLCSAKRKKKEIFTAWAEKARWCNCQVAAGGPQCTGSNRLALLREVLTGESGRCWWRSVRAGLLCGTWFTTLPPSCRFHLNYSTNSSSIRAASSRGRGRKQESQAERRNGFFKVWAELISPPMLSFTEIIESKGCVSYLDNSSLRIFMLRLKLSSYFHTVYPSTVQKLHLLNMKHVSLDIANFFFFFANTPPSLCRFHQVCADSSRWPCTAFHLYLCTTIWPWKHFDHTGWGVLVRERRSLPVPPQISQCRTDFPPFHVAVSGSHAHLHSLIHQQSDRRLRWFFRGNNINDRYIS